MLRNTALNVAMMLVATGAVASATTIFSENFEESTVPIQEDFTPGVIGNTQFSLVQGSIDLNGPGAYPELCTAPTSGYCIDTQGSFTNTTTLGELETTNPIVFTNAGSYTLTFDLNGWYCPGGTTPPNSVDCGAGGITQSATVLVSLGALFTPQSITVNGANDPYLPVSITFTVGAGASAQLEFQTTAVSASYAGAILDNIAINTANTSVPEPGSVMLVGLGIAALAAARRRFAAR